MTDKSPGEESPRWRSSAGALTASEPGLEDCSSSCLLPPPLYDEEFAHTAPLAFNLDLSRSFTSAPATDTQPDLAQLPPGPPQRQLGLSIPHKPLMSNKRGVEAPTSLASKGRRASWPGAVRSSIKRVPRPHASKRRNQKSPVYPLSPPPGSRGLSDIGSQRLMYSGGEGLARGMRQAPVVRVDERPHLVHRPLLPLVQLSVRQEGAALEPPMGGGGKPVVPIVAGEGGGYPLPSHSFVGSAPPQAPAEHAGANGNQTEDAVRTVSQGVPCVGPCGSGGQLNKLWSLGAQAVVSNSSACASLEATGPSCVDGETPRIGSGVMSRLPPHEVLQSESPIPEAELAQALDPRRRPSKFAAALDAFAIKSPVPLSSDESDASVVRRDQKGGGHQGHQHSSTGSESSTGRRHRRKSTRQGVKGQNSEVMKTFGASSRQASQDRSTDASSRRSSLRGGKKAVPELGQASKRFTVTAEVLQQIKTMQGLRNTKRRAWSPTWGGKRETSLQTSHDMEDLVEAYVEYVCDDLMTKEDKTKSTTEELVNPWAINPGAKWRIRWDMLMLILVLYTSYSVPFRLAFGREVSYLSTSFDLISDLVYIADVAINFSTAYHEGEGTLQQDIKIIAKRYASTWLVLDLLSSVPIAFSEPYPTASRVLLFLRFTKVVRLPRFLHYIDNKEMAIFFKPSTLRLLYTMLLLTWAWHMVACMYWYVAWSEGLGTTEWTPATLAESNPDFVNYALAVVWTIQTTFSIGPQMPPETLKEAIFTIFSFVLGIFMNAYVLGSANSILQSLDEERTQRRELMDRIVSYMKKRKLPSFFQRIILDFYAFTVEKNSEERIFKDLPQAIQLRLSLLLNRELVKNIPLLKQLELNSIIYLMQTLQSHTYMPGEFVFKVGERGLALYFVKSGQLEVVLSNVSVIYNLQKGEMFGQVALINTAAHDFSVRAAVYSEVLILDRESHNELCVSDEKFCELVETESIRQEQFVMTARKNLQRHTKLSSRLGSMKAEGPARPDVHVRSPSIMAVASTIHSAQMLKRVSTLLHKGNHTKVYAA